ncbi:hypothetical protein [Burkholderia stabilis]
MNKTLTDDARATIMDACQSISRSADELKAGCADGDEWDNPEVKADYDAELRLLDRLVALLAAQQPEPPTFEAKHVSLKQKGAKLILTLELDGVESAPRYTVTPINPSVVRPQPEPRAEVTDDDLTALLPGTHYMDPPDGGNVSLFEQLRRMAEDAARYRASRAFDDEAREFLYGNLDTIQSAIDLAEATGNCSQARGLEAVEYQIRRLFSAQPEPRAEVADDDLEKQLAAVKLDALKLQRSGQMAATMSHNHIVVMQAAWIEWQYGEGAEGAMEWIENTLEGPGLIPNPDETHYREAQAYFDANRSLKLYDETLDAAIDAARAGGAS